MLPKSIFFFLIVKSKYVGDSFKLQLNKATILIWGSK